MGYFSNGSEGDDYEARYCARCVHEKEGGCPVILAHVLFAYDLCNDKEHPGKVMLDMFIPREGIENWECTMFVERASHFRGAVVA